MGVLWGACVHAGRLRKTHTCFAYTVACVLNVVVVAWDGAEVDWKRVRVRCVCV